MFFSRKISTGRDSPRDTIHARLSDLEARVLRLEGRPASERHMPLAQRTGSLEAALASLGRAGDFVYETPEEREGF